MVTRILASPMLSMQALMTRGCGGTPYDPRAIRQFVGIDLGNEPMPDETTMCRFRHL